MILSLRDKNIKLGIKIKTSFFFFIGKKHIKFFNFYVSVYKSLNLKSTKNYHKYILKIIIVKINKLSLY